MKKLLMGSIVLTMFSISVIIFQLSCKKEASSQTNSVQTGVSDQSQARVCDVKGVYVGSSTSHDGNSGPVVYRLQENNFAVSSLTLESANVTFGGYRNTCDSVFISVYFTGNANYYLLKGRLRNSKTVLKGTFQNLTQTSDYGTFTLTKQ